MNKVQAFAVLLNHHLDDLSASWLARRLEVDPSTVNRWRNGESVPREVETVKRICKELQLTTTDCQALLEAAGHVVILQTSPNPIFLDNQIDLFRSVGTWLTAAFHWDEMPADAKKSWASQFLFAFGSVMKRVTVERLLALALASLLFFAAAWLMQPLLRWPIPDPAGRTRAALMWAAASLLLPAAIAFLTTPDGNDMFPALDARKRRDVILLKLVGAYNGFHVVALPAFFLALILFYLSLGPLPDLLLALLVGASLLFTYVAARTTPLMRYRMLGGEMRLHAFDPTFLTVFVLIGPFFALCFVFGYSTLVQPGMGLALLIALIALILWEFRKKHPDALSAPAVILLYGLLFPSILLALAFWQTLPAPSLSRTDAPLLLGSASILLSETCLLATLFVRQPPTLTIRGVLGALLITLALLAILQFGGELAGGMAGVGVLLAAILFRRRYRQWLWFHPSFGVFQLALLLALILETQTPLSPWFIWPPLLIVALILIRWAYGRR